MVSSVKIFFSEVLYFPTQESQYSKLVSGDVSMCRQNNLVKGIFFLFYQVLNLQRKLVRISIFFVKVLSNT